MTIARLLDHVSAEIDITHKAIKISSANLVMTILFQNDFSKQIAYPKEIRNLIAKLFLM